MFDKIASVEQIRAKLADFALKITVLLMVFALAGSLARIQDVGFIPLFGIHIFLCSTLLFTYLFNRFVPSGVQAIILIVCLFLAGAFGTIEYGVVGNGVQMMFSASLICAFVLNIRSAVWLGAAGGVLIIICSWAFYQDLTIPFTYHRYQDITLRDWLNATAVYLVFLGLTLFLIDRFFSYLKQLLIEKEQKIQSQSSRISESETLLNSVVNSLPYGVLWKDKEARFIGANQIFLDDIGCDSIGHIQGKTDIELGFNELSEKFHQQDKRLAAGEVDSLTYEQKVIQLDGQSAFVMINRSPLKNEQGEVFGLVATYYDTTKRKELELSLQHAKELAEQSSLAKSQFLANMSHEIRTPINAVLGLLDLCLEQTHDTQQKDYLGRANASAKLLLRLINDVLDLSKIEAGQLTLEKIPFYPSKLSIQLIEMFTQQAAEKQIEFNVDSHASDEICLFADPTRIVQILMNLCSNAIKFTDKGQVSVSLDVKVEGTRADMHIQVKDSGIGIPENKIDSLFDHFTQADAATTRKFGGTGLGLAIVKELTLLMSGTVEVESKVDKGSCFSVHLPLEISEQSKCSLSPEIEQEDISLSSTRLLVVEDNLINQEIAKSMLEKAGAVVEIAENGKQGLTAIAENKFDLVLMDIQMPVMDGIDAIKAIRRYSKYEALPVIAVTANVMQEDIENYKTLGFNGHLGKPFERQQLLEAVEAAIN